jgi:hypothetical protein
MQRKTKQLSLGFGLLLAIFLTLTFDTQSTSAFSLNITTSGPISTNVIPASDGSIGTSIVTDEINITSNCRAGYTLTIASPSDNNLYLNGDDTNNASNTYFTPVNGTNALNHTANTNKWGYTLASDASASTIFSPFPSTATILRTPSQTASPSNDIDHTIPIHYGTAVDGTMDPGSYTFANNGTITYAVTMDPSCLNYSVQYQGNNPDNPNGMGTTDESTGEKSVRQTNVSEGTTITLLAPNFKKQGYGFLGWSTDEDAYNHFTDNDNTNDPVIYGPNETVTIDGVDFNIPDGFEVDPTNTTQKAVESLIEDGAQIESKGYVKGDTAIGLFVVNITNGLTNEQALKVMGGDNTTINNVTGYLKKDGDITLFNFEKNDRIVVISSSDEKIIGDFLIA